MFTLRNTVARSATLASLVLITIGSLAVGCGGHGGGTHPKVGRLRFTVIWPDEALARTVHSRVIPVSAQSLRVDVKQGATLVSSAIIARPATTTTFSDLPAGAMSVVASAFASTDGTGTPLATATVSTTIASNVTATVDVTMASTIDHLEVTPSPYTVGALQSGTINVVGKDASNAVVLIDPSSLSFSSSNSTVASVTSGGVVTAGAAVGSATISISEADSGKSLSLPLSVVPAVSITPVSPTVEIRGAATFVGTVVGPVNTAVTYSVQEGSSGGTITSGGVYTAPGARGTYHVVATSVADTSRKATATVTVTSGGLNVNVH